MAAFHVNVSRTAFGIQKETGAPEIRKDHMYGSHPGLGIDINEEIAAKLPITEGRKGSAYDTDRTIGGTGIIPSPVKGRLRLTLVILRGLQHGVHAPEQISQSGVGPILRRIAGACPPPPLPCLRPGFSLSSSLSGPVVDAVPRKGAHGHSPDHPELRAFFAVEGAGIGRGVRLGEIDMRAIAHSRVGPAAQSMSALDGLQQGNLVNVSQS